MSHTVNLVALIIREKTVYPYTLFPLTIREKTVYPYTLFPLIIREKTVYPYTLLTSLCSTGRKLTQGILTLYYTVLNN